MSSVRERLYEALRGAVRSWGGQEALAAELALDAPDVSRRLNRREHKGSICRAPIDWIAAVCASCPEAADVFVREVCDALGFEPPIRKRVKTEREKLRSIVRELRLAGELGEAALARAARRDGFNPSEFDGDEG